MFYVFVLCKDLIGKMMLVGMCLDSDEVVVNVLFDEVGVVIVYGSVFGFGLYICIVYVFDDVFLWKVCMVI